MGNSAVKFWESKKLKDLNPDEWESLCDGCARCCMVKLEDDDSQDIHYTRVACKLLDIQGCRCSDYRNRHARVPDCLQIHARMTIEFSWLPPSCAYRRLHEGRTLPDWHPLISGDKTTVHTSGFSMRGQCVSEKHVHPSLLPEQIISFMESD